MLHDETNICYSYVLDVTSVDFPDNVISLSYFRLLIVLTYGFKILSFYLEAGLHLFTISYLKILEMIIEQNNFYLLFSFISFDLIYVKIILLIAS